MQDSIVPEPSVVSTSPFMALVRGWSQDVETRLAVAAQRVSDALLEDRSAEESIDGKSRAGEFARIARSLRKIHTHMEWFLRPCQAQSMVAKIDTLASSISADGAQMGCNEVKEYLMKDLPGGEGRKTILGRLRSVHRSLTVISSRLDALKQEAKYPSSFETEMSNSDLLRVSEIMEMSNHGLTGLAGALHGFTYGDMSRDRFADFVKKGCAFHTVRINGEIGGFFLDAPPLFMERWKSNVSAQYDATGKTAPVMAIAVDPGCREGSVHLRKATKLGCAPPAARHSDSVGRSCSPTKYKRNQCSYLSWRVLTFTCCG
jgi:hypothetical protein